MGSGKQAQMVEIILGCDDETLGRLQRQHRDDYLNALRNMLPHENPQREFAESMAANWWPMA